MTGSTAGRRPARHPRRSARSRLAALIVTPLLAAAMLPALPARADPEPVTSGVAFTIGDPRITESSGLAADSDNNVFWTVNDSGDHGVVYAIGPEGRTRGTVEFSATPKDVEAVAYANGRLYVADIGDNQHNRESVTIYVISSPIPGHDVGSNYSAYRFVYPDGPRDAEAILVGADGRIRIISKEARGGIYLAPRQLSTSGVNRLERVADAKAYVTDATVLPDGRFAVRTYVAVEVLDRDLYAPVARATLPFQPQGESITVSLAGTALLVGSEGPQSAVLRVPIPSELVAVPDAADTPPPSPSPTPAPTPAAEPGITATINRTGTLIAIGLAVVLAIVAGAVVYLRDRGTRAPAALAARRGRDGDDDRTPQQSRSEGPAGGPPDGNPAEVNDAHADAHADARAHAETDPHAEMDPHAQTGPHPETGAHAEPDAGTGARAAGPDQARPRDEAGVRTILRDPGGNVRDPWEWSAPPEQRPDAPSVAPEESAFDWDASARQFRSAGNAGEDELQPWELGRRHHADGDDPRRGADRPRRADDDRPRRADDDRPRRADDDRPRRADDDRPRRGY